MDTDKLMAMVNTDGFRDVAFVVALVAILLSWSIMTEGLVGVVENVV